MKRLSSKSKRGFTLLEVMLAVVILTIASTMIMKGFIAVMILSKNNSRYAASGEYNYRRAMNETVINNATSGAQDDVITNLADRRSSTITATFDYAALHMDASNLNLTVDVSAFVDATAPVFGEASGHPLTVSGDAEPLDLNTVVNSRFAFFYDYGDFIGVLDSEGNPNGHIYRWGYVRARSLPEGTPTNCYVTIYSDPPTNRHVQEYHIYGWYCFNKDHSTTVTRADGSTVTTLDSCRTTPVRYGRIPG
jgi:prepilin-type N-terminal cleavage/methylation domain-containing protein